MRSAIELRQTGGTQPTTSTIDENITQHVLQESTPRATVDMKSTADASKPLPQNVARKLISTILTNGRVGYSRHAREEMEKDDLTEVDVTNVLRGGRIFEPAEMGQASWTYRVHTPRQCVVVTFRNDTELVVVTAWRK
ncbi:DUF4258 domain-containing protein [Myxococcus sp. RHSTA-1-4]|uniref:DUF4258 domain-containing protein n=1 Tax=Myxococcus sp. RHSTA-1-4 TaxID=2874601 RepID=UPI001CBCF5C4|nr:DUF4258 domain-containing protein [Myxococcus sp. RHSTA-1-4]MBZ4419819.1 DUF4258 domain-containing protein [Myxococcus sp. RHSTA-1-4]